MHKILLPLLLLVMAACGGKQASTQEAENQPTPVKAETPEVSIIGDTIADINVLTRYGKTSNLRAELPYDLNLIAIYNPDNENYRHTFDEMNMSSTLNRLLMDKKLGVVIIDERGSKEDLIMRSTYFLPTWVVTADLSGNINNQMIPTPYNPTIYLVDKQGVIIEQVSSAAGIIERISRQSEN